MKSPLRGAWGPVAGLAAVFLFFALFGPPGFMGPRNLETIARQTAIVATASMGACLVIAAGCIDLSAGSLVALTTVIVAALLQAGLGPWTAALAALSAAAAAGFMNGVLVTRLKVAPFIGTLGTLLLFRGLAKGLAHEQKIDAPLTSLAGLLAALPPDRRYLLVPSGVWLALGLSGLVAFLLRRTRFGRHALALGSNEKAAILCGVDSAGVKTLAYAVAGTLVGAAGLLQFSRLTVGDPTVAVGLELDAIAAVVIGGGSLSGGEVSVPGALVGALITAVIRSGCSQSGVPNWIQEIITGVLIVAAVAGERLRKRVGYNGSK